MKRWLALLLACLALGLVVAGCGDDDDDDGGDAQTTEQPAEESGGDDGANAGGEVVMKEIKFVPPELTVAAGDTVTWTNEDTVGHDVTGDSFSSGDAGGLQNGDTFKFTFKKAGTFDYVCTVHPGMEGSVTVE
jgi:plastocyanin